MNIGKPARFYVFALAVCLLLQAAALAFAEGDGSDKAYREWRYFYNTTRFTDSERQYIARSFSFPYEFDGVLVYVDGNNIMRGMRGNLESAEVLYTDTTPGDIVYFVAEPDMAFILKGDEASSEGYIWPDRQYQKESRGLNYSIRGGPLYRLDFATGRSELVATLQGASVLLPLTRNEIVWTRYGRCFALAEHDNYTCEERDHDEENYSFYLNLLNGENVPLWEYCDWVLPGRETGRERIDRIRSGDNYQVPPSRKVPDYSDIIIPNTSARTWTQGSSSAPAVRNFVIPLCVGALIRFDTTHSLLLSAIDFDGVVVHEINLGTGRQKSGVHRRLTYAELAEEHSGISSSYSRAHLTSYINMGAGHTICSRGGCSAIEAHYATTVPGYCVKCRVYGCW